MLVLIISLVIIDGALVVLHSMNKPSRGTY
jgi:hypothetical protein